MNPLFCYKKYRYLEFVKQPLTINTRLLCEKLPIHTILVKTMRKIIYLFFWCCPFFFISENIKAQEATESSVIQTISIKKGEQQKVHDKAYYESKIKEIDELLEAIEVKTEYVRSNETENKIALENGWYENMEQVKKEAREQRFEYESIIKKMTN